MSTHLNRIEFSEFLNNSIDVHLNSHNADVEVVNNFLQYCEDLLKQPKFDCNTRQLESYINKNVEVKTSTKTNLLTIEFFNAANELLRQTYKEVIHI